MKSSRLVKRETHITVGGHEAVIEFYSGFVPKVNLISCTENPEELMATLANGYNGVYDDFLMFEDRDNIEVLKLVEDIKSTALRTPMEAVQLTWLIQDVTRAWTHQAVRYRVGASYVQESMRFWGKRDAYKVFVPKTVLDEPLALDEYMRACAKGIKGYVQMRSLGIPDQDCRGSLPTNILTQMFMTVTLNTQAHIINTRWCCQAQQSEWMPVMLQMRQQMQEVNLDQFMSPPIEQGKSCGYGASFDRPCVWKNRSLQEIEEGLE